MEGLEKTLGRSTWGCQLAELCNLTMEHGMTDLDGAVAWTGAGDEGATTGVFRVHADAGAGAGAASLLDAALDVSCTGAVAGFVIALGCTVAGLLACAGFAGNRA